MHLRTRHCPTIRELLRLNNRFFLRAAILAIGSISAADIDGCKEQVFRESLRIITVDPIERILQRDKTDGRFRAVQ